MSFSAFFSCENPESGYLLGHIGKCRRGEELDDAECTALSPLFLSGLTLLISESRKSMSIHTCVCTHTHTDAHTHPGACKRIPCLPSIDECPSVATLYQARVGSRARQGMDGREWFLPSGCFWTDTQTFQCNSISYCSHCCDRGTGAPETWTSGH